MSRAVVPRIQGDEYQARYFWLEACRLLFPNSHVVKVAYEVNNVKSFDDIAVYYQTPEADADTGQQVVADYHQVKFHVTQNRAITVEGLMDPGFINASSVSLLQRLRNAQLELAPDGTGVRFYVTAPWIIDPDDPLSELVSNTTGAIRLDRLFDGNGDHSKMGRVRAAWREHLGISDEELRVTLMPLRIRANAPNLEQLNDSLGDKLFRAGLKPLESCSLANAYDDLIRKLTASGTTVFNRNDLEDICKRERLWVGQVAAPSTASSIGIRSFTRWAEHLEDETDQLLCLVRHFDNRRIRRPEAWNRDIVQEVRDFLSATVRPGGKYDLHLETHASIAFAAGHFLDPKAGVDVAPVQRTRGRNVWRPENRAGSDGYPSWAWSESLGDPSASDVALALSVTHPIDEDVRRYIRDSGLSVRRILHGHVEPGPGPASIQDGTHAWRLASEVARQLKERTPEERNDRLHVFCAAPNGLIFFLGQLSWSFGKSRLYEYDFESNRPGAYEPSIDLPFES